MRTLSAATALNGAELAVEDNYVQTPATTTGPFALLTATDVNGTFATPANSGVASHLGGGRFLQPDKSERFLVDEAFLADAQARLGGELADPLKTTVVQNARSMTTWVVRKQSRVAGR